MKASLLLLVVGVVAVIQAVAMPTTATVISWGDKVDDPRTTRRLYGGWNPIGNIDDPCIQELGEWAVSEHVKRSWMNSRLKFVKVVGGEEQTVAGMNYLFFIQAINGYGKSVTYKARVYERSWTNTRKVVSFGSAN